MPVTKVTLSEPIEFGGKTITDVVVRSPKVREVRQMQESARKGGDQLDEAIAAIQLLTDLPEGSVEEMDATDIMTLSEAIEGFFPKARG